MQNGLKMYKLKNMKKILYLFVSAVLMTACQNDNKSTKSIVQTASAEPKSKAKNDTNKIPSGKVEVSIDGKTYTLANFDQKLTTVVTLLNTGLQFRINDVNKQHIQVSLSAPDLLQSVPITISQQTSALEPGEVYSVKTQSSVNFVIPSTQPVQGDTKTLLKGTVTLEEYSESKLVITFSGSGYKLGDNKKNTFPMQGKIVFENFKVYDGRM